MIVQSAESNARIDKDSDGKVFITDLGSTNGTFKNGLKLNAQSAEKLVPGDEVAFAGLVFDLQMIVLYLNI